MLIKVPFSYEASVTKKRHKNPETLYFWEVLDVEVAVLDDISAPVATRWHDEIPQFLPNYGQRVEWGTPPKGGIMETRWHEDTHFWPVLCIDRNNTMNPAPKMTAEVLVEKCTERQESNNPLIKDFYNRGHAEPVSLSYEDYREVHSTTRHKAIASVMEKASNLIIVDGQVWVKGGEPVHYLKEVFLDGTSLQMVIKTLPHDSKFIKSPLQAYRADRFEQAAEASIIADDGGLTDINSKRKIEVFLHDSIRYDGEEQAILRSVTDVIEKYQGKTLKSIPDDVLEAFVPLRSYLNRASKDYEHLDAMTENFENFLMTIQFEDETSFKQGMNAIERWRHRPIQIDFGNFRP